ncbi:MAG: endonuclease III domain-containing protein [Desulfobacteraceae bacterium]|nr:endonuclease III domain-containing protein [Desulfobacteraceae bacterium]
MGKTIYLSGSLNPAIRQPHGFGPVGDKLLLIYERLYGHFGSQRWWPAETSFEVCVGAILTQNTSWDNVKKAVSNLKSRQLLEPAVLYNLPRDMLAEFIRPAGYFNVKAQRLHAFIDFLMGRFGGDLNAMFSSGLEDLRPALLNVKGIGPETADSIILYAGGLPTFVVDAYTIRALLRHDLIGQDAEYEEVRSIFMDHLPVDPALFNEFHALWVALGKTYCKKTGPKCDACPLTGV